MLLGCDESTPILILPISFHGSASPHMFRPKLNIDLPRSRTCLLIDASIPNMLKSGLSVWRSMPCWSWNINQNRNLRQSHVFFKTKILNILKTTRASSWSFHGKPRLRPGVPYYFLGTSGHHPIVSSLRPSYSHGQIPSDDPPWDRFEKDGKQICLIMFTIDSYSKYWNILKYIGDIFCKSM